MKRNISYSSGERTSAWRKVSLGSWRPTGDSSTYCWDDLQIGELERLCQERSLSLHALVLKALCATVAAHPQINRVVRFGKICQREKASVFFHVLPEEGDDLSGFTVEEAHRLSNEELEQRFAEGVELAKRGKAPLEDSKRLFKFIPGFLSKMVLDLVSFINYSLNLQFASPQDAFGSVMLTSVGSLGIPRALTPIAPYTRNSMVVAMGTRREAPIVTDGEVTVGRMMTFGFVFDHRLMEGKGFASFLKTFRTHIEQPYESELFSA